MTEHTKEFDGKDYRTPQYAAEEMLYALVCSGGRTPQRALNMLGMRPQGVLAAFFGSIANVNEDQVTFYWNKVAPAVRRRLQNQIKDSND